MSFRDTAIGTPSERRVAVRNFGDIAQLAIGVTRAGGAMEWALADNLDRNDLMVLSEQMREVAETLPQEPPC